MRGLLFVVTVIAVGVCCEALSLDNHGGNNGMVRQQVLAQDDDDDEGSMKLMLELMFPHGEDAELDQVIAEVEKGVLEVTSRRPKLVGGSTESKPKSKTKRDSKSKKRGSIVMLQVDIQLPREDWEKDLVLRKLRSKLMKDHPSKPNHMELESASGKGYSWKAVAKPNILLVVADDLGYNDVGYRNANPRVDPTPTLTKLRPKSVELKYLYSYALCAPSRGAIFTGRLASRHGFGPSNPSVEAPLSGRETLIPEILKGAGGYYTVLVEKWHLGFESRENHPLNRGFDSFLGPFSIEYKSRTTKAINANGGKKEDYRNFLIDDGDMDGSFVYTLFNATQIPHMKETWEGNPFPPLYDRNGGWETMHNVDIIRKEQRRMMNNFIKSDSRNKPLFWYMGTRMPHADKKKKMNPPSEYETDRNLKAMFKKAGKNKDRVRYLQMVHAMDKQLGELIAEFERYGMWKDTVMIFLSDNTGLANNVGWADNSPLQGRKGLVWDMRVVNLFHGTSSSKSPLDLNTWGSMNEDLFHVVDLLPTIASGIAQIPEKDYHQAWKCKECIAHQGNRLDGQNLWDSIKKRGGNDPLKTSKRLLIPYVFTQDQYTLSNGTDKEIQAILPPSQYSEKFWASTSYSREMERVSTNFDTVREVAACAGTGYMLYGRYEIFFGPVASSRGDPGLNPSQRKNLHGKVDPAVDISFLLNMFDDLPSEIKGHPNADGAYLHDIYADEEKTINLFKYKENMDPKLIKVAHHMLKEYIQEQTPSRSVMDNWLRVAWVGDPALKYAQSFINQPIIGMSLRSLGTNSKRSAIAPCDISVICPQFPVIHDF